MSTPWPHFQCASLILLKNGPQGPCSGLVPCDTHQSKDQSAQTSIHTVKDLRKETDTENRTMCLSDPQLWCNLYRTPPGCLFSTAPGPVNMNTPAAQETLVFHLTEFFISPSPSPKVSGGWSRFMFELRFEPATSQLSLIHI